MASKKFEKNSDEWKLFTDFWSLCQKFWQPEDNEKYWQDVIDAANIFFSKYKDTNAVFAKELVVAFTNSLEERLKNK